MSQLKRRRFLVFAGISAISSIVLGLRFARRQALCLPPDQAIASDLEKSQIEKDLLCRFVSVGDTGTGGIGAYAVARAMETYHKSYPYNLVILAGDNIYNNGNIKKIKRVFDDVYQPLLTKNVQFRACLGNHDVRTNSGLDELDYPELNMEGRYYSFVKNNVHFFALDTNQIDDWQLQLRWLEQELMSSQSPWKIVFGHHPIYSSGKYGNNDYFIETLTPLFRQYNVQVYINGHEHNYERTQSIDGTTYIICGAGSKHRSVGHSGFTECSLGDLSFVVYEVYGDRLRISGIDRNSIIFDRGWIERIPTVAPSVRVQDATLNL